MKSDARPSYATIEAEEARLDELLSMHCTQLNRYEDLPEFQYLMGRRIERFKQQTNPGRGRAHDVDRGEYGYDGPGIKECPLPSGYEDDSLESW